MEILYLSEEELAQIDPTGKARQKIEALKGDPYRSPANPYIKPARRSQDELRRVVDLVTRTQTEWAANKPDRMKWIEWSYPALAKIAPQGGRYEFSYLLDELAKYYTNAQRIVVRSHPSMELGMHVLLNTIHSRISSKGGVWPYEHHPVEGTLAGLPSMAKKGTYTAETAHAAYRFRHLFDAVPGERVLKNKKRVIFNDANSNVRMVEGILAYARHLLKVYIPEWFYGWMNPNHGLRQTISDALLQHWSNVETDQTAMDQHFTRGVVERYILPIYKALLPPGDYDVLALYVSEMFEQKLFLGDREWSGEHAMFSGQPPTNDFETIVQLEAYLGAVHKVIVLPKFHIVVCGDDAGLLARASSDELEKVHDELLEIFSSLGFELSVEKSRKNTGDFAFCKKYYSLVMPRLPGTNIIGGGYSPYYSLNSIFYPESTPLRPGVAHSSALQILDNLEFTPAVQPLLDWVQSVLLPAEISQADIDYVNARDWWYKVYGEVWKPESSWAWRILKTK